MPSARKARRRASSTRCRPARICTRCSATKPTSASSICCSPKIRTNEGQMSETVTAPRPKKSVALSGVPAGNTALCTVGRSGNDLHYRGYDILDFADAAEFEEVAYLLVHEKLPTAAELAGYKKKLRGLRGLPPAVKTALEAV